MVCPARRNTRIGGSYRCFSCLGSVVNALYTLLSTANKQTHLLSTSLGCPDRDSESNVFTLSCCFSAGEAIAEKVQQTSGEGFTRRSEGGEVRRTLLVPYEESQSIGGEAVVFPSLYDRTSSLGISEFLLTASEDYVSDKRSLRSVMPTHPDSERHSRGVSATCVAYPLPFLPMKTASASKMSALHQPHGRIASQVSQTDIAGEAARSARGVSSRMPVAPELIADQPRITPHHQDDTQNSLPTHNTHFFRPPPPLHNPTSLECINQIPRVWTGEELPDCLPRNGFRVALGSTLVPASPLDRTLSLRLGRRADPYHNFTVLRRVSDANCAVYLCLLRKCGESKQYRQTALLDFPNTACLKETNLSLPHTFPMVRSLTLATLGNSNPPSKHTSRYRYCFINEIILDLLPDPRIFAHDLFERHHPMLVGHPAKLVQLGSLFGLHRSKFSDPTHKAIRKQIRRRISLKSPLLQKS